MTRPKKKNKKKKSQTHQRETAALATDWSLTHAPPLNHVRNSRAGRPPRPAAALRRFTTARAPPECGGMRGSYDTLAATEGTVLSRGGVWCTVHYCVQYHHAIPFTTPSKPRANTKRAPSSQPVGPKRMTSKPPALLSSVPGDAALPTRALTSASLTLTTHC